MKKNIDFDEKGITANKFIRKNKLYRGDKCPICSVILIGVIRDKKINVMCENCGWEN